MLVLLRIALKSVASFKAVSKLNWSSIIDLSVGTANLEKPLVACSLQRSKKILINANVSEFQLTQNQLFAMQSSHRAAIPQDSSSNIPHRRLRSRMSGSSQATASIADDQHLEYSLLCSHAPKRTWNQRRTPFFMQQAEITIVTTVAARELANSRQ